MFLFLIPVVVVGGLVAYCKSKKNHEIKCDECDKYHNRLYTKKCNQCNSCTLIIPCEDCLYTEFNNNHYRNNNNWEGNNNWGGNNWGGNNADCGEALIILIVIMVTLVLIYGIISCLYEWYDKKKKFKKFLREWKIRHYNRPLRKFVNLYKHYKRSATLWKIAEYYTAKKYSPENMALLCQEWTYLDF